MKRHRIFALLLLSGLVGAIALLLLTRLNLMSTNRPASAPTTGKPPTVELPTTSPESSAPLEVPEPQAIPPVPRTAPRPTQIPRELVIPQAPSTRSMPSLESSALEFADAAVKNALDKLPQGEVYHNVPEQMKVNIAEIIEAGIAPDVTDKIKQELQGKGQLEIQSGVRFDPSGMEMRLIVNPNEFEVLEVKGGKQFVTTSTPGKWIWAVTPLQPGERLIVVKAIVDLEVPELNVTRPVEVEVFRATRKVEVNPVHSLSQFVSSNWKEITGLVIGSGSLVGLIGWWNSRKLKRFE